MAVSPTSPLKPSGLAATAALCNPTQATSLPLPPAPPQAALPSLPPVPPPTDSFARLLKANDPLARITDSQPTIAPLTPTELFKLKQWGGQLPAVVAALSTNVLASPETAQQRLAMMLRINDALAGTPQQADLATLLNTQKLTDTTGDDRHSTLYHLYGILTTPRADGLNAKTTLKETVAFLANPDSNEQNFTTLSPDNTRLMQAVLARPILDAHQNQSPVNVATTDQLAVTMTNTCAASAQMSRLASQSPKEFARHMNEASSAGATVFEKASAFQINPGDPTLSEKILQHWNLTYHKLDTDDFLVELPVPRLGLIRAVNAQQHPEADKGTGIEALYQTLIVYNGARKNYDAATDTRDGLDLAQVAINNSASLTPKQKEQLFTLMDQEPNWAGVRGKIVSQLDQWKAGSPEDRNAITSALTQTTVGLTEDERTLMERIIEDGEPIRSVTYQINGGPNNPNRETENKLFLYGYARTFDQMASDLVRGLQTGRQLIAGITFSQGGEMVGGHVIKLNDSFVDPQDGQLKFHVTDSDDGIKAPVVVSARTLIPQLHHVGLPDGIARDIWADIDSRPNTFYRPDVADTSAYDVVDVAPDAQPPVGTFLPGQYKQLAAQQAAQEQIAQAIADPFRLPPLPDAPTLSPPVKPLPSY